MLRVMEILPVQVTKLAFLSVNDIEMEIFISSNIVPSTISYSFLEEI